MDIGRHGNVGERTTMTMKTWTEASRQRCSRLLGMMLSVCSLCLSGVDAYSLRVRVQPGRAVGGEPFLEQPQVEILEGEGGDIDVFFEVSNASKTLSAFPRCGSTKRLRSSGGSPEKMLRNIFLPFVRRSWILTRCDVIRKSRTLTLVHLGSNCQALDGIMQ